MDQKEQQQKKPSGLLNLSGDWLAVIIGLGLAFLVWMGVITNVPWPLFGLFK